MTLASKYTFLIQLSITLNGYYSPRKALKFHHYQVFDVALAQKEQSPYDPSANCEMYDSLRGYFQCVTHAAEKTFWKLLVVCPLGSPKIMTSFARMRISKLQTASCRKTVIHMAKILQVDEQLYRKFFYLTGPPLNLPVGQ